MTSQIFNANGIRVERVRSTLVVGGDTIPYQFIDIWAGRKLTMTVREPCTSGSGGLSRGRITIYGDWDVSVPQDLNLLQSTTIDGLPPYSEPANSTTSARVAGRTETTIETGELTTVRDGITWVTKIIYITAGEDKLTLNLPLARPASPDLTPNGLRPNWVPSIVISGQWILKKVYKSSKLPVQPTIASTPNVFRRMFAMIKTLGSTGSSKQPKEKEKEATAPAVKG